jgi:catechol 2,3-dioxygenase-like lactoylglutathione lyase family enzyme
VILGASHITLACDDLDTAVVGLRDYGYLPEFIDRKVINNTSKRPILTGHCEVHGIALLRSETGFPIELVSYRDKMPNGFGRYVGVFETARPVCLADNAEFGASFSGMPSDVVSRWAAGVIGDLDAPAFFVRGAHTNAGLRGVVLPVSSIERARKLWCGVLGFGLINETQRSAELQFVSPIAAWQLRLVLVASPPPKTRSVLDAKGMTCLSLLSSNVLSDVPRLVAGGAKLLTEIFSIPINGRNLKVAIFADQDGAFLELLQIVR